LPLLGTGVGLAIVVVLEELEVTTVVVEELVDELVEVPLLE
jgi:hypothetical protein